MIDAIALYMLAFFRDPDVIKSAVIGAIMIGGTLFAAAGLRWQP